MSADKITETVTVEREVTGVVMDLVNFARSLAPITPELLANDEYMVRSARDYWDRHHGE